MVAQILFKGIRQELLTHQPYEHYGFGHKNPTVGRIQAINVLTGNPISYCFPVSTSGLCSYFNTLQQFFAQSTAQRVEKLGLRIVVLWNPNH